MPDGAVSVRGSSLISLEPTGVPLATIGDTPARTTLSRQTEVTVHIPSGSISGDLVLRHAGGESNPLYMRVAVPMAENLHPVGNPVIDGDGAVYATFSGTRGQQVPVSIFRIERDFQVRPFVKDLLNATGMAFGPGGDLYVSSRAEGIIYRVDNRGTATPFAEGLGLATGIAFDQDGNLFVGDRSGTIFKVPPDRGAGASHSEREIFVFATLEPSIAAYHLAFNSQGTLFVAGPTTSSSQAVHAIDRDGTVSTYFKGLGRAQGMALDAEDNLYVAASYRSRKGLVRITPGREVSLALSGSNLVGLAFLDDGCAALATRDSLLHVDLGITGRTLPFLSAGTQ